MNIQKLYRNTKNELKRVDWDMKNVPKVCTSECSACCHQSVAVLAPEGLVLEKYIEETLTEEQKNQQKNEPKLG